LQITQDLSPYSGVSRLQEIAEKLKVTYESLVNAICFAHYDAKNTKLFGKTYYFSKISIKCVNLKTFIINERFTIDDIPLTAPFYLLHTGNIDQNIEFPTKET
jgi:hypothetical protein